MPLAARLGWPGWLRGEPLLVVGLVLVALVAHALNMFNYPAFTFGEDEGIYAAQSWAILRLGELTPYTYNYDHAPAGWIMTAGWLWLTGGPSTFGTAIEGGRVLMLLLHLAMVPLLYHLARKLGCGVAAAALAALMFSVSPLAVFYQRLLLLDSLMLFWLLLSLDLLLNGWGRLSRLALSGACFGLAVLSKETAIILLPACLYIAVQERRQHQGPFALSGWLTPMLIVVSWYFLLALLKGELLPAGPAANRVSLLDALSWQAARDGGGLLNLSNDFWQLLRTDWLPRDPVLVVGGTVATLLKLLRGRRDPRALAVGLLGLLPLAYLARGGLVLGFYILAAIPFLCLNLAAVATPLLMRLPRPATALAAVVLAGGLVAGYWQTGGAAPLYTQRPSDVGREAVSWIKTHVDPASTIVTRDDFWEQLHEPSADGPAFPNTYSHWKLAQDPAIRDDIFHGDWHNIDYVLLSGDTLRQDFETANNRLALDALANAHLVKSWRQEGTVAYLHPPPVIELWKVDRPGATERALLDGSARHLSRTFERDGAFVDPSGAVTSEAQAYALLRAVWSDDRPAFDRAWSWTQRHLINEHGLASWLWHSDADVDTHSAADADTDLALALLMAGQRWQDPALIERGRAHVRAIWANDVEVVRGTPYMSAGDWGSGTAIVALNPSYFAPYAYSIFAEVDPEHDWRGLIDSSYRVIFDASAAPLGAARSDGLPPDWVGVDRTTGELVPLLFDNADTTRYGYDAPRTYWRVALHLRWSGDGRASTYLNLSSFLRDEVNRKGAPSAVYARDGAIVQEPPSLVGNAGALATLLTLDPKVADGLYTSQFVATSNWAGPTAYWGTNPRDLYGQEWSWFATALYADALPDLWHHPH